MPAPHPNTATYLSGVARHQLVPHFLLTTDPPYPAQARNLYLNRARAHLVDIAAARGQILAGPISEHWEPAWMIGTGDDAQLVGEFWARHDRIGLDVEGPMPPPTSWAVRYAALTVELGLAN